MSSHPDAHTSNADDLWTVVAIIALVVVILSLWCCFIVACVVYINMHMKDRGRGFSEGWDVESGEGFRPPHFHDNRDNRWHGRGSGATLGRARPQGEFVTERVQKSRPKSRASPTAWGMLPQTLARGQISVTKRATGSRQSRQDDDIAIHSEDY